MKNNTLQKPLINSAIILVLLTLLLHLTGSSPEATIWGSLGLVIMTVLKALQWLIGMTFAVLFCLLVLFAIFFGAVALFDPAVSSRMYNDLLQFLKSQLLAALSTSGQCGCPVQSCCPEPAGPTSIVLEQDDQQKKKMNDEIGRIREHLHRTRDVLTKKIAQLTSRIEDLEQLTVDMASTSQLESLSHEVQDAVHSLDGIQDAVNTMQSCVEQTASQVQDISSEKILGDLPGRIQTLEQQQNTQPAQPEPVDISPLQNDIVAMQSELSQVKEKADKALQAASDNATVLSAQEQGPASASAAEDKEEHRIFSYFDNPEDKEKIADLVQSTLHKNMTYKQVINFLVQELDSSNGEIISSHPALTKDYIRECRKIK
ncbi:MAG: hypothetical protein ACL93V_15050 [Candidatus Electrothrix sp. YB6]